MKKLAFFIIKVVNKLFINKIKGNPKDQDIFEYFLRLSIEGKSFGLAGDITESGEIHSIRTINRYLEKKAIIFDVGANKGQFQQELINHLSIEEYAIHSFEPSPSTYQILQSQDRKNCTNHNLGFGSIKEKLKLYRTSEGSPLSSLHQKTGKDYYNVELKEYEDVQIDTIETFCRENDIPKIDFLKLDIEGHELFALQGAKSMIESGKISFIQFEFGPPNIDSRTFLRDIVQLLEQNYDIYRVLKNGLFKLDYSETEEIFLPINYFAARKGTLKS